MDVEAIFVVGTIFIGLPWVNLNYVTKWKTAATITSDEELKAFQHTIFTQDQPVLESQRPKRLPLSMGEVHCAADRSSAAYRRFLRDAGITFGVLT